MMARPLPVICLAGPTGCGKTDMAIGIARELGCEIINADSRQVYTDFPIITAQPTEREKAGIPHHLYGFLAAGQKISAGEWARMAIREIRSVVERGKIPLLVGGTGLYFQALLRGIAAIPAIDPAISARIEERIAGEGTEILHAELARIDPVYASKVHPRDRQRIARALEVAMGTGKPFSWWHEHSMPQPACQGPLAVVDIPLERLEPGLERRIRNMLAAGALEEARQALAACPDKKAPGWSGIGCGELLCLLEGAIGEEECIKLWLANTRAYAKRQRTWFRQRREAVFFAPGDMAGIIALCRENSHDRAASTKI